MTFEFEDAKRLASPLLIGLAGITGAGKTYGALLLAAGITGGEGIGLADTENGRGSMHADDAGIVKAIPKGYKRLPFSPPYEPSRYVAAIKAAEARNLKLLIIDSTSHEWEGIGGCTDIAEKKRRGGMDNWAEAKLEHKRFLNYCLTSSLHIIFCLRARDKIKLEKVNGKDTPVSIGIQAITEKNFMFEMTLSLMLDDDTNNFYRRVKAPGPLRSIFKGGELLTVEHGRKLREWNSSGASVDESAQLITRSRVEAERGTEAYKAFFISLLPAQKQIVEPHHEGNKKLAQAAEDELMRQAIENARLSE